MFIIRTRNRSCAAFADNLLNRSKRSLLAGQIHWDVKRTSLRVVGHRTPTLESCCAGTLIDLDTQLWDLAWKVCHFPVLRVDLNDRLITQIRRVDELARRPVQLPEDSEFTHFENRLSSTGVDENPLENFIHILRLAG